MRCDPRIGKSDRQVRYYRIGGLTLQVTSDLPMGPDTFAPKVRAFACEGPGEDTLVISHHFEMPAFSEEALGLEVYRHPPWRIFRAPAGWTYLGSLPWDPEGEPFQAAFFDEDHTRGEIHHRDPEVFQRGGAHSLTLFPTDQILLARVLPDRGGVMVHGAGVILRGEGFLFAGHSGAGKTTVARLLRERGTVLCDDRVIVRKEGEGFRLYGTWSHGDLPLVSPASAPLRGVFFLRKADRHRIRSVNPLRERYARLLACLVRPVTDRGWWQKALSVTEEILERAPCRELAFADGPGLADCVSASCSGEP